jgi:hypothetical protein
VNRVGDDEPKPLAVRDAMSGKVDDHGVRRSGSRQGGNDRRDSRRNIADMRPRQPFEGQPDAVARGFAVDQLYDACAFQYFGPIPCSTPMKAITRAGCRGRCWNWILRRSATARKDSTKLAAGLFMVGYDVPQQSALESASGRSSS